MVGHGDDDAVDVATIEQILITACRTPMTPKRTVSPGATGLEIAARASVSSGMPLVARIPPVAIAPVCRNSLRENLLDM
jgi:hypothetical protein